MVFQIFPSKRTVAHHRLYFQPHDYNDGASSSFNNGPTENDERP